MLRHIKKMECDQSTIFSLRESLPFFEDALFGARVVLLFTIVASLVEVLGGQPGLVIFFWRLFPAEMIINKAS